MEKRHHTHEKKLSKSFTSQTTLPKFNKKVEPLTRTFFSQLLKLETAFYNKQFTASTLDELIQCYAKAVEYYDTIKDEIASYFIFKIQDALATKKSLKLLIEETSKVQDRKNSGLTPSSSPDDGIKKNVSRILSDEKNLKNEVIQENLNEESSGEEEDDDDDPAVKQFAKKKKAYLQQKNKKAKASFATMISQKQRFVHFFHKMETHKVNQKQDMHVLLNDFNDSSKENDAKIMNDLAKQKDRLKNMIEQRKQKSFMTQTLNSNSYFLTTRSMFNFGDGFSKRDMSETNAFDDMLRELDDADIPQFSAALQAETPTDIKNAENVLYDKTNNEPIIENTPKTVKSNNITNGNTREDLGLSPITSAAEGVQRENIAPNKGLQIHSTKISSEDVKENFS